MNTPLVLVRQVSKPVTEVWDLCTTAEGLERWWWPMWPDTVYEIDARVLHTYRFATDQGGHAVRGDYIVVEKYHVLEFSWDWEGDPDTDHVRVVFTPVDAGTQVTLTHTITEPSHEAHTAYSTGWTDMLDRLVALAE